MVCLVLALMSVAQPGAVDTRRLLGQSEQTAKRLAEAERVLLAGKPADALDQLLAVQADAGDDLVSVDGLTFRPARRVAQRLLVKLPPPTLRTFRDRVDGPAAALLAAGTRDRDPRPLRTLLDRYFPATPAGPALLLLGELLFERGEFGQAEACWRRLLPGGDPLADPSMPDPPADPARVRALVTLAVIFQGEKTRAAAELEALRKSHQTVAGRLAGVEGVYADTLARLAPKRPPATGDGEWTGFAGSAARDGRATGRLPRYWPTRPTWHTRLLGVNDRPAVVPTPTARSVAFHPVVLDGVGYVADPLRVYAFDPVGGASRVAFDLRSDQRVQALPVDPGSATPTADADFTLTVADGRLFARLGLFPSPVAADPMGRPTSFLVCLAPAGDPSRPGLDVRWVIAPPAREGAAVAWEAAPVYAGGRVYAAFTRLDGTTRTFAVAAYPDPPGEQPLWVAEVATAPAGEPRVRHEPLTVADGKLLYCTHAGSVVALDPATGKPAWAVKYPTPLRPLPSPGPPRDLCPPLAAGGRVFVAPLDSDVLLALDVDTGRRLWAADGLLVDQLLGVSQGKLVVTLAGPQKGIRGLDAATGDDREPAGWRTHDDPRLGSFGRGLVTDDLILWPTAQGLFLLNPDTGRPVAQPLPGTHGNLAFAAGVLLVGTPFGVAGFVPDRLLENSPRGRALALADAGRIAEAVQLVRTAGLPDAERLAAWWTPPTPPAPAEGSAVTVPPPSPTATPPARVGTVARVTRFASPVLPLRSFADGPELPGLADPNPLLLVTDGPRVLAFHPGGDAPVWAAALPDGVRVSRAAVIGRDVFLAGTHAAARLDRADGRLVWAFVPPEPADGPRPSRPPLPPVLADFCLAGSRLCCRCGGHTLLALDLATGRLVWARDGLFRRFEPFPFPSAPGFTHLSAPDSRRLLARRSDGRVLLLEPAAGDLIGVVPTTVAAWEGPPARLGDDLVAVPDGPDRVSALDPRTAKPVWSATLGGEYASLSGRPPQVLPAGSGLVVASSRTIGTELEFIRAADGGRVAGWPEEPVFLPAATVDLAAAAADAGIVYVPGDGVLYAVRLSDGGLAWRVPLPGPGRWRVRCGSEVLLIPADAAPAEPFPAVASRAAARFLRHSHAGRLPVLLLGLYDAWAGRTAAVVRLDPATGKEVGRLSLPAAGPACGVHLGPGPGVVVTATAAHWLN